MTHAHHQHAAHVHGGAAAHVHGASGSHVHVADDDQPRDAAFSLLRASALVRSGFVAALIAALWAGVLWTTS